MKMTVEEIATLVAGTVIGDKTAAIIGITNHLSPLKDNLTFIDNPTHLGILERSEIGCIIVPEKVTVSTKTCIRVKNPKLAFANVMHVFFPARTFSSGISPKASIGQNTQIGKNVTIEPFAVINDNVAIGANTTIRSFAYIDNSVTIGAHCLIHPNVMVYDRTEIGNNVIIHSSSVIGSDGFGYVKDDSGNQVKVPQVGNVIIEDNVELGSNVSIDRATFGSTIIRNGVKIDNLVQIAHNADIGTNTVISGHAGIAGSTKIGKNCIIAAAAGIGDHVVLEDNVILGGKAGVASKKRLRSHNLYMGVPARPFKKFAEIQGILAKLPFFIADMKKLKLQFAEYEKKIGERKS
jgi:UDP-3-O-[3-hydroxymyristoyl] glucosamine N-acyltransferase